MIRCTCCTLTAHDTVRVVVSALIDTVSAHDVLLSGIELEIVKIDNEREHCDSDEGIEHIH